ncbi:hypothetical protein Hanom_Chr08g00732221 [Helianthus anomalus]
MMMKSMRKQWLIKHQKRKQYALFFFNTPFSLLPKYFLELKHKASGGSLKRHEIESDEESPQERQLPHLIVERHLFMIAMKSKIYTSW